MQIYASDKTSPRSFPWLWYIRLVALVVTLIVVGITVWNTASFSSAGCDAPARLLYNLAVAGLSFIVLIYFILASGPFRITRLIPWFMVGQLVLDILVFIFWISAAATSSYSCTDLCNACGILDGYVSFDGLSCTCFDASIFERDYSPRPRNVLQSRGNHANSRRDDSTAGGSVTAKEAFDAVMTVLFAVFLIADIIWMVKSRNTGTTTAPAPLSSVPMKNEEAGMPMGGVGAPTYTQQPNPQNNNQMAPQGGYTGQPTQNQGGSPQQPVPQEQYFGGQYPQGQPQYSQDPSPYSQNQPQYPNQSPYSQTQQVPSQSYPSPQGEYPPQYVSPVPQQASYPPPRDGVSEMHSPTETLKMNDSHHV